MRRIRQEEEEEEGEGDGNEFTYLFQYVIIFIIITVSLVNLTLNVSPQELWLNLLFLAIGYSLPNTALPKLLNTILKRSKIIGTNNRSRPVINDVCDVYYRNEIRSIYIR